jgi:hypothetical protein
VASILQKAQISLTGLSMEKRHSVVQDLARELTHNTSGSVDDPVGKPVFGSNDPRSPLNPHCKKFNTCAWATNVAKVIDASGQSFRQVGLCFQNLNVFGYGHQLTSRRMSAMYGLLCQAWFAASSPARQEVARLESTSYASLTASSAPARCA